jgi:hypothetical protein
LHPRGGKLVPLPRYPWQHKRHWIASSDAQPKSVAGHSRAPRAEDIALTVSAPEPEPLEAQPKAAADIRLDISLLDRLRNLVAGVLEIPAGEIPLHQPLTAIGLDSIVGTRLKHLIQADTGVDIPLVRFIDGSTLATLSELLIDRPAMARPTVSPGAPSEIVSTEPSGAVPLPASLAQHRLWLLHTIEPQSAGYNVPIAGYLKGSLNEAALAQGLNEVIRRHEILRTTFQLRNRKLVQLISPASAIAIPLIDLKDVPNSVRATECERLILEYASRPFDLARGPVLRAALFRLGRKEHVFVLSMHHIVSDAWSIRLLAQELTTLYRAFSTGKPSPLDEPKMQYADFARLEQIRLPEQVIGRQLAFWREQLRDAPASLRLPPDHRESLRASSRGDQRSIELSGDLIHTLRTAGRHYEVTPFVTMLTALNILLFRWTGQEDIVVGTAAATRTMPEAKELIGCLVNFVPLRVRVHPDERCVDLLRRVRKVVLDALQNQDCPFDRIVETLGHRSAGTRHPIYNVGFVFHSSELSEQLQTLKLDESLVATFREVEMQSSLLDLRFVVDEGPASMRVRCEYASDLLTPQTADTLLRSYAAVLERLARFPDFRVSKFHLDEFFTESTIGGGPSIPPSGAHPGPREEPTAALLRIVEQLSDSQAETMVVESGKNA